MKATVFENFLLGSDREWKNEGAEYIKGNTSSVSLCINRQHKNVEIMPVYLGRVSAGGSMGSCMNLSVRLGFAKEYQICCYWVPEYRTVINRQLSRGMFGTPEDNSIRFVDDIEGIFNQKCASIREELFKWITENRDTIAPATHFDTKLAEKIYSSGQHRTNIKKEAESIVDFVCRRLKDKTSPDIDPLGLVLGDQSQVDDFIDYAHNYATCTIAESKAISAYCTKKPIQRLCNQVFADTHDPF